MDAAGPVRVVVVNDYEVVVRGLRQMLEPFSDELTLTELLAGVTADVDSDIVLYDTFAAVQGAALDVATVLRESRARALVVYSWNVDETHVADALRAGADGYLSKGLSAPEIVDALKRINEGEILRPDAGTVEDAQAGDWPGRREGLSARQAELIALVTQALSNDDIAERAGLSINTVKSYLRVAYRRMGVQTRSQAIVWALDHGFRRSHVRIRTDDRTAP